jgi:hypothetical protein
MRTFLIFSAAAVALASPAGAATRNFGITSFTKVRVDGPFDVALKTGIAPYARASGSPAALDRVAIDVRGDTLVVHSSLDSWGGYPGKDVGPVEISLGTHDLTDAWLNGSGSLSIDRVKGLTFGMSIQGSGIADIGNADVDQLSVSVMGSGSATLGGRAAKITAVIRGASKLDAANLAAKDATLGAEGTATISAKVTNSATIDANGPATVQLDGSPACTVRSSGSASVRGCH